MEAQLVKHASGYILFDEKGIPIGAIPNVLSNGTFSKLSLKNCQAIERGYDLDELAENYAKGKSSSDVFKDAHKRDFIEGAKAILEIIGDKKFSEVNMEDAYYFGSKKLREEYLDFVKTFQQTEWEVEIQIDTVLSFEANQENAKVNPNFGKPLLDKDGCLILKRI